MNQLADKRVVIIGGSSGIGLGAARAAIAAGATVTIAGSNAQKADAVAAELGPTATGAQVDVRDARSIQTLFDGLGGLDHLFFTAAPGKTGAFLELPLDDARRYLDGHFWGSYIAAKSAAPRLRSGGSITFLSGGYNRRPHPGTAMVCASQSAIEGLARALAVELSPTRVNVIVPGVIDTPLWNVMSEKDKQSFFSTQAVALPAKRVGTPQDIGNAFVFLASETFITGSMLEVNGGFFLV